jgi:hypothetical protein
MLRLISIAIPKSIESLILPAKVNFSMINP